MSYRVELAKSGRAVCNSTECKKAGIKIDKDELRLGTWVAFEDRGSFHWRHWGCVTGKVIENLRTKLEDPNKSGSYRWEFLDGYDEDDDKSSLKGHPEMQEKVRRVITQGFIDPEDFNGDPEMNVLGETGLRTKESKRKMREEEKARTHYIAELEATIAAQATELDALRQAQAGSSTIKQETGPKVKHTDSDVQARNESESPKKKPATKKRGRKQEADDEDDDGSPKPAKKKRATKAKKEVDEDDEEVKPAPKKRGKKVKSEDQDEEMVDADDAADVKSPPAKKPRAKKGVKKEEEDTIVKAEEDETIAPPAAKKSRAKKPVKKEEPEAENGNIKDEPVENGNTDLADTKNLPKKRGKRAAVKNEPTDEEADELADTKPPPKKRGKKAAVKNEAIDEDADELADTKPIPKKRAAKGKKAVKEEAVKEEDEDEKEDIKPEADETPTKAEDEDEEEKLVVEETPVEAVKEEGKVVKKARGKKTAKATTSTRSSRSQTTSKA